MACKPNKNNAFTQIKKLVNKRFYNHQLNRCAMVPQEKRVICTRGVVEIYDRKYVLYSGYMTPNELIQFSDVPSFTHDATNVDIANNLTQDPVKEWQRPIDKQRLEEIRANIDQAIDSDGSRDTLMANPVLIGRSDQIPANPSPHKPNVVAKLHTVKYEHTDGSSHNVPVPGIYEVTISMPSDDKKPLWILDGQHRIHALGQSPYPENSKGEYVEFNASKIADQLIPIVFVIEANYTPQFLAKIFTEVTTKAEAMSGIHEDWMTYAFKMRPYDKQKSRDAMATVIELCRTQSVDSIANPFYNEIQFNPLEKEFGVGTMQLSSLEWRALLEKNYFGKLGPKTEKKSPEDIVKTFLRFFRACTKLDQKHKSGKSKLLSSPKKDGSGGSKFLAKKFFEAFFDYIAYEVDSFAKNQADWEKFLSIEARNFHNCDWELEEITTGSMETNAARTASEKALMLSFQRFFRNPSSFDNEDIVSYFFGPDVFEYRTAKFAAKFPAAASTTMYDSHRAVGGNDIVKVNLRGKNHGQIKFVSLKDSLTTIVELKVSDDGGKEKKITRKNVHTGLRFKPGPTKKEAVIKVKTLCLGEDSEKTTTIKLTY